MNEDEQQTIDGIIERAADIYQVEQDHIRAQGHKTREESEAQFAVALAVHLALPEFELTAIGRLIGRPQWTCEQIEALLNNLKNAARSNFVYMDIIARILSNGDAVVIEVNPIEMMLVRHGIPHVLSA